MSKELIELLDKMKRAIKEKITEAENKKAKIEHDHGWVHLPPGTPPESNAAMLEIEEDFRKANSEEVAAKAKLDSAEFFGPRHTRGLIPALCIKCFIEHDRKESPMVEVPVGPDCWDGKRQFECREPGCGFVFRVDPDLNPE